MSPPHQSHRVRSGLPCSCRREDPAQGHGHRESLRTAVWLLDHQVGCFVQIRDPISFKPEPQSYPKSSPGEAGALAQRPRDPRPRPGQGQQLRETTLWTVQVHQHTAGVGTVILLPAGGNHPPPPTRQPRGARRPGEWERQHTPWTLSLPISEELTFKQY